METNNESQLALALERIMNRLQVMHLDMGGKHRYVFINDSRCGKYGYDDYGFAYSVLEEYKNSQKSE
jgi:hypothetical protein